MIWSFDADDMDFYRIEPINISDTYRWAVAGDLMLLTWR